MNTLERLTKINELLLQTPMTLEEICSKFPYKKSKIRKEVNFLVSKGLLEKLKNNTYRAYKSVTTEELQDLFNKNPSRPSNDNLKGIIEDFFKSHPEDSFTLGDVYTHVKNYTTEATAKSVSTQLRKLLKGNLLSVYEIFESSNVTAIVYKLNSPSEYVLKSIPSDLTIDQVVKCINILYDNNLVHTCYYEEALNILNLGELDPLLSCTDPFVALRYLAIRGQVSLKSIVDILIQHCEVDKDSILIGELYWEPLLRTSETKSRELECSNLF